jgi:hypothetical protein
MIRADEVMPLCVQACPTFTAEWERLRVDDGFLDDGGEPLYCCYAEEFIAHLVQLRLAGETQSFPAVFTVIEQLLTDGNAYVKNLAVIGFLEGLQMRTVTDAGIDPAEFRPYFGLQSEQWWQRVNRFWEGDATALRARDP